MWCLTPDESRQWAETHGFALDDRHHPLLDGREKSVTLSLVDGKWSRLAPLSSFLVSQLDPFDECFLWVTLWGVWSSSENLHLFYRVRESYGERRQLAQAPGHRFLRHESADLATFIQMGLQFGWDFYLLPAPTHHAAFISHDEFLQFSTNDAKVAEQVQHFFDSE
jgi:hypothetical protein